MATAEIILARLESVNALPKISLGSLPTRNNNQTTDDAANPVPANSAGAVTLAALAGVGILFYKLAL